MDALLKQRLTGAAVLVALAVIVLPFFIGGADTDEVDVSSIPVDVPARDGRQFQTRDLSLSPNLPIANAPTVEDDVVATVDLSDEAPRVDALSQRPVLETVTEEPAPAAAPVETAPAETAPKPVADSAGRWAVNLGSYANQRNADVLVEQLRKQGLPVYEEAANHDGKPVRRVRAGPFAQRSEAESMRLDIQKLRPDLPLGVVSLETTDAPPAVRPAPAEGFAVQIGAVRNEADANTLRERARGAGLPAYVERNRGDDGVWWRVRVGPELDRAAADRTRAEIKTKLGIDGHVVPHP